MKKKLLFILLFTLYSVLINAQLGIDVGAGYSISKHSPVAKMGISYKFPWCMTIEGGFHSHIDSHNPAFFNGRIGTELHINEIIHIRLSGGYGWELVSTDNKSLNSGAIIYGVEAIYNIFGTNAQYTLNFSQYRNYSFITIGIRGLIFFK